MSPLKTHKVARWFLRVGLNHGRGTAYEVLATESEIRELQKLKDADRLFLQGQWVMRAGDDFPP
jgi:hypothetical protein